MRRPGGVKWVSSRFRSARFSLSGRVAKHGDNLGADSIPSEIGLLISSDNVRLTMPSRSIYCGMMALLLTGGSPAARV
jgi:hypothetical protein